MFYSVNSELCRIKRYQSIFTAKKVNLKDGISISDVKDSGIRSKEDKGYEDLVKPNDSKNNGHLFSKYLKYHGDLSYMDDDVLPYYLIDKKLKLYNLIADIRDNEGFKFKNTADLKKHIMTVLQDSGYSKECLKRGVDYFFEKNYQSYQTKKKRFIDKAYANLEIWNYFATFTYDSSLMDAEDFYKKLIKFLRNKTDRNNWKYIGCFEKSKKGRLHFHALMSIPFQDVEALKLVEERYYDKSIGDMNIAHVSEVLRSKFGRCDFAPVYGEDESFVNCLAYICKYIYKDGNKLIYCRGLKSEYLGLVPNFDENIIGFQYNSNEFYVLDSSIVQEIEMI